MRLLLLGGNGQVGRELRRSLPALGELVVATRDGAGADAVADFDAPGSLAALVARVAPDVVVKAVAYTAVDRAETDAEKSIAVSCGYQGIARGNLGAWLVLAERADDGEIKHVRCGKVDGKVLLPGVFYQLKNKKFVVVD